MFSMYQWLGVLTVFAIVTIAYAFSQNRRRRINQQVTSLQLSRLSKVNPTKNQSLPDYLLPLYGKRYVTRQKVYRETPSPTADVTNQNAQVYEDNGNQVVALDPQFEKQDYVTLSEDFIPKNTNTDTSIQTVSSDTVAPPKPDWLTPISIRQKYQPVRPDLIHIHGLGDIGS